MIPVFILNWAGTRLSYPLFTCDGDKLKQSWSSPLGWQRFSSLYRPQNSSMPSQLRRPVVICQVIIELGLYFVLVEK